MSGYSKYFYETKRMNFLTEDGKLLKAYSKSWKKISNLIKKGVDNVNQYDEKYSRTKIKSYDSKINKFSW